MFEGLPEVCYGRLLSTGEIIIIKRGEKGYYPCDFPKENDVDWLNEGLGVTKAQAEAMFAGSLFGWEVPAANPENYDIEGKLKKGL